MAQESEVAIPERDETQVAELEALLLRMLHSELHERGLLEEGKTTTAVHQRWLMESRRRLSQAPQSSVAERASLWRAWEVYRDRGWADCEQRAALQLMDATLRALPEILSGRRSAPEVMFPNGSMALVEGLYKGSRVSDYFNAVLAQSLIEYVEARLRAEPQARLRVIEIGAGTGGTSALLFDWMSISHRSRAATT